MSVQVYEGNGVKRPKVKFLVKVVEGVHTYFLRRAGGHSWLDTTEKSATRFSTKEKARTACGDLCGFKFYHFEIMEDL